jgi:DNA processing protein
MEALDIQLIAINSAHYPELLKQISDPPPLLYVRGNMALLNQPQLGMVGSRNTSRQGRDNAFRFAREFALAGFTITSGLAIGIDSECHQGALAAEGKTIGVLATGVDKVYPVRNRSLFDTMVAGDKSAVISEFPLGTQPLRHLFPMRNRIISGMSLGVLVVEAALKSGSLITARCAMEQGREVFAIPGSIHSTGSHGVHALIQQGAKLVSTAADVMEELEGWLPCPAKEPKEAELQVGGSLVGLSKAEQKMLSLLGFDPVFIDLLQHQTGWPMAQLSSVLTTLELKGWVENKAGCYQRIVKEG